MKKAVCLIFILSWAIQFSYAQSGPSEIYSAYRYYLSDKTKTGTGFKLRNSVKLNHECLFSVYNDRIIYEREKTIVYKIYKTKVYSDDTHYFATDLGGQYYDIVIEDDKVAKKQYYAVTIYKTDKNNKWLSVTRFDVNKVK